MAFEISLDNARILILNQVGMRNRSPGKWSSLQRSYASEIFYEQFRTFSKVHRVQIQWKFFKFSPVSFKRLHQTRISIQLFLTDYSLSNSVTVAYCHSFNTQHLMLQNFWIKNYRFLMA